MSRDRSRWCMMIIYALITLAVLIAGRSGYQYLAVERPFISEISEVTGITDVTLIRDIGKRTISFRIVPNSYFPSIFRQAYKISERAFGPKGFQLIIIDERTERLESLYRDMQLHIEEAIINGAFSQAATRIEQIAINSGVDEAFYVDEDFLYLELHEQEASLYIVRLRNTAEKGSGIS